MKGLLRKRYLSREVVLELQRFISPFLKETHQHYFGFDRVYNNNTCIRITTHPELLEYSHFHELKITVPIPEMYLYKDRFYYLVSGKVDLIFPKFGSFKKKFNIKSSIYFIDRKKTYYNQYWFGSSLDLEHWDNFYINSTQSFERFFAEFDKKYQALISEAEKDRIELPLAMRSNIKGISKTTKVLSKYSPTYRRQSNLISTEISLSKREKECIALILLGLTSAEIGDYLDLSIRTVEHYIDNIKDKLNCSKKGQISTVIYQSKQFERFIEEFQLIINQYLAAKSLANSF